MLVANSTAILTDAFPSNQRGLRARHQPGRGSGRAVHRAGRGRAAGGPRLAAVFWVNVPVGVFGTVWAYRKLRDNGERHPGRIDWWGNITFAVGLSAILIAITNGIQPYRAHAMGWTNPKVWVLFALGALLLVAFVVIETRVAEPMFSSACSASGRSPPATWRRFAVAIARGGLQFMLIIWLQGIWLPLHGYNYSDTPLWAGIFLLPLTAGFLISGPVSGSLSDRFGARGFATAGMLVFGRQLHRAPVAARSTSPTGPSPFSSLPTASATACSPPPTRRPS